MKQVLQSLRNGNLFLEDIPIPAKKDGNVLIKTYYSVISSGTERTLLEFGKAGFLEKARSQPDKVKQVIAKLKTDGLAPTMDTVFNKLNQPISLGYCNMGIVKDVGANVKGIKVGDRVISNGSHAEYVSIPANLCAKVPDGVKDEHASFAVLSSISLQGVRLCNPTIGETISVIGLGIIGLIVTQILKANGCEVIAIDYDRKKLSIAEKYGCRIVDLSKHNLPIKEILNMTNGRGVDASIICASTKSNDPVHLAASTLRKRGRIILVGVTGLNLKREDFYEKEITFQVSSSYGPGRYDKNYEDKGIDYPIGFVRWTEKRNFDAVLEMIRTNKINIEELISHKFKFKSIYKAYELILTQKDNLGIVIEYNKKDQKIKNKDRNINNYNFITKQINKSIPTISFIGSGNYTSKILIPEFKKKNVYLDAIVSENGISSSHNGKKYNFKKISTDSDGVIQSKSSNTIVISTRHDTHAEYILKAINHNKNIFVEKPLCLNLKDLNKIKKSYLSKKYQGIMMIGFNRRFSPLIKKARTLLEAIKTPSSFIYTINAGNIPSDHWTQDPKVGGGRIIGEVCHFIDLLRNLNGSKIIETNKVTLDDNTRDTISIHLKFENGSIGVINYFANGNSKYQKERIDIYNSGKIIIIDNFKKISTYGWPSFKNKSYFFQNKGQSECISSFINSIKDGSETPIPFNEIVEIAEICIELSN